MYSYYSTHSNRKPSNLFYSDADHWGPRWDFSLGAHGSFQQPWRESKKTMLQRQLTGREESLWVFHRERQSHFTNTHFWCKGSMLESPPENGKELQFPSRKVEAACYFWHQSHLQRRGGEILFPCPLQLSFQCFCKQVRWKQTCLLSQQPN